MTDLGQRVADAVVTAFGKLNVKSGKPTTRSNGVSEWTVLAGLVAIDGDELTVVSIATGVKALPDEVRSFSNGYMVHDMHAEILCLRLFNRYLMEEVKGDCHRLLLESATTNTESVTSSGLSETREGPEEAGNSDANDGPEHSKFSKNLKFKSETYRLKPSLKLALYISEPPCGDASMSHVANGQTAWEEPAQKRQKVVRGRANFGHLGTVRTKPGRADSKLSLSKSCSDKLCLKQYTGILNCITSLRIEPIFLDFLVLDETKHVDADFRRCFHERMSQKPECPLQALTYRDNNFPFSKDPERTPSPVSLAYIAISNTAHVINNGVKNGANAKKPRANGASPLSRRSLWQQAAGHVPTFASYNKLKQANKERQNLKLKARKLLGSWPQTGEDDFCL
ncbi:hypothetical protein OXX69_008159 [Metschnikowia pulcherrima]